MKSISCFLAIVLSATSSSFGQSAFSSTYKPGSTLYVWATSGLSLRATADIKSAVLTVVAFGEGVVVQADSKPRVAFTSGGINGAWVRVRYGQFEGYQFDGFLSRWQTPAASQEIEDYLTAHFKIKSQTNQPPDSNVYNMYRVVEFEKGIHYEWIAPVGGSEVRTEIPTNLITFQEAYLLARQIYPELAKVPYKEDSMTAAGDNESSQVFLDGSKTRPIYVITYGIAD